MSKYPKLKGFIAAPFTCFNPDSSLNLDAIPSYASFLKANGVIGAFVLGTTGEGISMTSSERLAAAKTWIAQQTDQFKIIVHVGAASLEESRVLAAAAQKEGAYGVGAMAPSFFKAPNNDLLVDYIASLAAACPDLPFYYYHIPSLSGLYHSMPNFLMKAEHQIPNLAGIKYTHHNLMEMNECLMYGNGKYDILHGFDEILICGLSLGVNAAVGSTYNYMMPVYQKLYNAFKAGKIEVAQEMQRKSVQLVQVLVKYGGGLTCGKAIMNLIGLECGPCRLPIRTLSEPEMERLKFDLKRIGFLD